MHSNSNANVRNNDQTKSKDVFNWLDNKMNDMKIGKKTLNSIAMENQKQINTHPSSGVAVSRNATVFQFPDLSDNNRSDHGGKIISSIEENMIPKNSIKDNINAKSDPIYAVVNKSNKSSVQNEIPSNSIMSTSMVGGHPMKSSTTTSSQIFSEQQNSQLKQELQQRQQNMIMSQQQQSQKQHEIYQTFQKQTSASALPLPTSTATMQNAIPPIASASNQQIQNWSANPGMPNQQPRMPIPNLPMMTWPSRPLQLQQQQVHPPHMFHQQNQNSGVPRMHHPHCNSVRGLRPPPNNIPQMTSTSSSSIMTQSYPGPNILQPQKADPQHMMTNSAKTGEQHFDKEFIAELEKNLGISEANANLMPPASPAVDPTSSSSSSTSIQASKNGNVPALLPPPQTTRQSNRRNQSVSNSTSHAPSNSTVAHFPQRRNDSVTRYILDALKSHNKISVKFFLGDSARFWHIFPYF